MTRKPNQRDFDTKPHTEDVGDPYSCYSVNDGLTILRRGRAWSGGHAVMAINYNWRPEAFLLEAETNLYDSARLAEQGGSLALISAQLAGKPVTDRFLDGVHWFVGCAEHLQKLSTYKREHPSEEPPKPELSTILRVYPEKLLARIRAKHDRQDLDWSSILARQAWISFRVSRALWLTALEMLKAELTPHDVDAMLASDKAIHEFLDDLDHEGRTRLDPPKEVSELVRP